MNQADWLFDDLTNPLTLDASTHSDGWYTPHYIVAAARQVLGAIDLDPASCEAAQSVIQATTWYSKTDDGLLQPWTGRVWCNPPYSAPTKWVDKFIGHYHAGDITEGLMITNSYTETAWWQRLAANGAMLFFAGRLQFWHPDKTSDRNRTGQTLCYLGQNRNRFAAIFNRYGVIR